MIEKFVQKFEEVRLDVFESFKTRHPKGYTEVLKVLLENLSRGELFDFPDSGRIHGIQNGDYSGTLLFVIPDKGNESKFYTTQVNYGSCSHCDTFQRIRNESSSYEAPPTDSQAQQYLTLAIHLLQKMKKV